MINKIVLVGRIARDLELRTTQSGKQVCDFSIAVKRSFGEETDFFNVECWGKQAENICKYQKKGSLIGVVGELRVDTYTKDNEDRKFYTYVLTDKISFLESKKDNKAEAANEDMQETFNVAEDEDLPF